MMNVIIIMGVAGCGKTTVGKLLSAQMNIPFFDADDFHPDENVIKMSSGEPLTDIDREPWLETLSIKIREWANEGGAILACSALKEKYREQLMKYSSQCVNWIYLQSEIDMIRERLEKRQNHFFNPKILDNQFRDLEPPAYGLTVEVKDSPDLIVEKISSYLKFENKDI